MKIKTLFNADEEVSLSTYLAKNGIDNCKKYLKPTKSVLDDCYIYDNMTEAVRELKYHILNDSKICMVIDADFDGFSSAYIMYKYIRLQNSKCKIKMIIQDGKIRGLDSEFIRQQVYDAEPNCLILTDSGTNSAQYTDELFKRGIFLIVADHHEVDENVCKDWGIVVNNQLNHHECNRSLSGCGVTFKLLQALDKEFNTNYAERFIDLVGISIISDSMDVKTYENRWFIQYILDKSNIQNPFMVELFDKCLGDTYTQRDISFRIVPLINSVIRCGTVQEKQQLFMAFNGKDIEETYKMCTHYHNEQVNKVNKFIEHHQDEIDEQADSNITIIDAKDVPQNFSGLIAGKIGNITNKPCIVGKTTNGELGGSFRGYILKDVMKTLPHVNDAKGHPIGAYGIFLDTSKSQNLDDFRAEIDKMDISIDQEVIAAYKAKDFQMELFDEFVGHNDLWGKELDAPQFYISDITVKCSDITLCGKNNDTIKFKCGNIEFMFFKQTLSQVSLFRIGTKKQLKLNVIGKLDINTYNKYNPTKQVIVDDYEINVVKDNFEDLF